MDYFTLIDYKTSLVKNLFLEKQTDKKFFDKYIKKQNKDDDFKKRCCRRYCEGIINFNDKQDSN